MSKRALVFMNKGGSSFSYLLDDYPTAAIAYSFRKLRSAYAGNCIEVRRSSDNTTSNIGFVSNVLDETALLSFVGAGDGFIKTWYDQSGNANNMVQVTNSNQPKLVSSGVVITKAGKPAFYSNTTSQLDCGNFSTAYDSAFTVFQNETSGNDANYVLPFTTAVGSGSYYYGSTQSGSGASSNQNWGTPSLYKNGSASALANTRSALYTAFSTGIISLLSEFTSITLASLDRGLQYPLAGYRHVAYVQEHITYDSNQTSNKTGIETNINTFYSIY